MLRYLTASLALAFAIAACGDNLKLAPDSQGGNQPDAFVYEDAPANQLDAFVFKDAPADAGPPDLSGIGSAIAAGSGSDLSLPITNVFVTYLKPAGGNLADDPAGFTVQAQAAGPGLFVAVDPSTLGLSPALAVGDAIDFTITTMATVDAEPRAMAVTSVTRASTGNNIDGIVRDISSATDVVTNLAGYDSTIVTVAGTLNTAFASSGTGFMSSELNTTGISNNTSYTMRVPTAVLSAIDMVATCNVTATKIPVDRFNATVELGVYQASDVQLTGCPAPLLVSAVASTATTAVISFSRNIDPTTVMADGSQFTSDGGLSITAAVVAGRTITLTTSAQTGGTTYNITAASTLTDLQGTALAAPLTVPLVGFVTPATVVINELNANVTNSCDVIELRVMTDGSMGNFKITERLGNTASHEMNFTFPAGFTVTKNSIIMVHTNSSTPATCNPNGATQELNSPTDQPAATYVGNYDTAYDFWVDDDGLTATDNVITLYDGTGDIIDAVFLTTTNSGAADTLAQAGIVGAAAQWIPTASSYTVATYVAAAVLGLGSTSKTVTAGSTSIQRNTDTDTNMAADWVTGSESFGTLNADQTTLPAKPAAKKKTR